MMITNEELGRRIRQARAEKKLTQEQLAEMIGVSKQAVSNWERGENRIDEATKGILEEVLQVDLTTPIKRLERGSMTVKELEKIDNLDELLGYAEQIIDKTPIDNAFQASVRKLLQLTLNVVLGYEIYALSFERKRLERKNKENPNQAVTFVTNYDWRCVADDIDDLLNKNETAPYPREKNTWLFKNGKELFQRKIEYMLHAIGSELFEDFDDTGYRDGYIQQIGRLAEADAYRLLSMIALQDNAMITSYKISLLQVEEIIEDLTTAS